MNKKLKNKIIDQMNNIDSTINKIYQELSNKNIDNSDSSNNRCSQSHKSCKIFKGVKRHINNYFKSHSNNKRNGEEFDATYNKIYLKYVRIFTKQSKKLKSKINKKEPCKFIRIIVYHQIISDVRYALYKQFVHDLLFKLYNDRKDRM